MNRAIFFINVMFVATAALACPNEQIELEAYYAAQHINLSNCWKLPKETKEILVNDISDAKSVSTLEISKGNPFILSFITPCAGFHHSQWVLESTYDKKSFYLAQETNNRIEKEQTYAFIPLKEGDATLTFNISVVWVGTLITFSHAVEVHITNPVLPE